MPVCVDRDEHETPVRAEFSFTGQQIFGVHVDFDGDRGPTRGHDARQQLDQLTLSHGHVKIHAFAAGGDDRATRIARSRDERRLVHQGQRLAPVQRAVVVRLLGKDHFDQARFGEAPGLDRLHVRGSHRTRPQLAGLVCMAIPEFAFAEIRSGHEPSAQRRNSSRRMCGFVLGARERRTAAEPAIRRPPW